MALFSTEAIVISSIKYSDSSLIVRLFTAEKGLQSFLIKGVLSSKKGKINAAYFLPLSQLKIVANIQDQRNLQSLREVSILHPYKTLGVAIKKQSIVLFLSEILSYCIQEQEKNEPLYEFLKHSFIWLDNHEKVSNFHVYFLLQLTKYLGFYPDVSFLEAQAFNLHEGEFTSFGPKEQLITGEKLKCFKRLLGINFEVLDSTQFTRKERKELLDMMIKYYETHVQGFRLPKSLKVLESVFS